ncbi:MAG: YkgJ family cysteine cluster protein [Acidobacteriota bacterium]|nr:YkgJ family cysteine cluster protein [Acidobacteriota bacterium]
MKGPISLPVLPTAGLPAQVDICANQCQARCCKYIIVKIPAPRTRMDHEEIRWWVAHEGVSVHIAQRKWYLQVFTRCTHLTPNNLCSAYDKRPDVCRDYEPDNCEFTAELDIQREFRTMQEYDQYLEEKRFKRRGINAQRGRLQTSNGRRLNR